MKTSQFSFCTPKSEFSRDDFRSFYYKGNWQKAFINNYIDHAKLHGFEKANINFSDYKKEHLPKNLYKFFSPTTYSLINLQNKHLWLSSPINFNDPFDSYVGVEENTYIKKYILEELKKKKLVSENVTQHTISQEEYWRLFYSYSKSKELRFGDRRKQFSSEYTKIAIGKNSDFRLSLHTLCAEGQEECIKKITDIRNIPFRIACFSNFENEQELGENTTMWSHYANNHKGFCVKYSLNFGNSVIDDVIKCGFFKVIYSNKISNTSIRELIKLKYNEGQLEINSYILKSLYKALITKSRFWSYEKEWRLIIGKDNFNLMKDGNIPFPLIDSIFLGCKMENPLKKHIIQFAKSNNITIFQARQSNEIFNLEFDNIGT